MFIERCHNFRSAIYGRCGLVLREMRHAIASEAAYFVFVNHASASAVCYVVFVVNWGQKRFEITYKMKRNSVLFVVVLEFQYAFVRLVWIRIFDDLGWVTQTERLVLLKAFGSGKGMQTTVANVGFICTASPACHESRNIFNPHVVVLPVLFNQKQIHVMCAIAVRAQIFNAELTIGITKDQNIYTHMRIQVFEFGHVFRCYGKFQITKFQFVFVCIVI